jgi:dTDP-3-amino-3,4,6-trideoxy-alpha-D-glucose transaminase
VTWRVPFASLVPSEDAGDVRQAIERVVSSGWFVLGPEVEAFEAAFAGAMGAAHAVGVGSGTDAITLALRALGIGRGDEVITTPLSAAYTALAIRRAGAQPVFADIDARRLTIDPAQVESLVSSRTRAIVPVHLYGQAADMTSLETVARRHNLAIVEDCCQAHLATAKGRPVGTIGAAGAYSFYPTKNLGGLGDGGAVVTNDPALAARIRRLRNGGQVDRYRHHDADAVNSRLDEMQAAILRARLPYLRGWTARRRALAAGYRRLLSGVGGVALVPEIDAGHVYHLFVVRVPDARDAMQKALAARGVETLIHYPVPIPRQEAFAAPTPAACPVAERLCEEILSLPLTPRLNDAEVELVAAEIHDVLLAPGPAGTGPSTMPLGRMDA